jgi:hypothetical protein
VVEAASKVVEHSHAAPVAVEAAAPVVVKESLAKRVEKAAKERIAAYEEKARDLRFETLVSGGRVERCAYDIICGATN